MSKETLTASQLVKGDVVKDSTGKRVTILSVDLRPSGTVKVYTRNNMLIYFCSEEVDVYAKRSTR